MALIWVCNFSFRVNWNVWMLKTETKSVVMPKKAFTYTTSKTSANLLEWNTMCESIRKFRPPTKNRVVLVFLEKKISKHCLVWFSVVQAAIFIDSSIRQGSEWRKILFNNSQNIQRKRWLTFFRFNKKVTKDFLHLGGKLRGLA